MISLLIKKHYCSILPCLIPFLFLLYAANVFAQSNNDLRAVFNQVHSLQEQNKIDESIRVLRSTHRSVPQNIPIISQLGWAYLSKGDAESAIEWFQKGIDRAPRASENFFGLGEALSMNGQQEKAQLAYEEGARVNGGDGTSYTGLGRIFRERGEYEQAIEILTKGLTVAQPVDPTAYKERGMTFYEMGHYKKANTDLQRFLEFFPESAEIYETLGRTSLFQKEYKQAIRCFKKAIRLKPVVHFSYEGIGRAYHALGKNDRAVKWFTKQIKREPNNANYHHGLGLVYQRMGMNEQAQKHLMFAMGTGDKYSCPYQALSVLRVSMGENKEAERLLLQGVQEAPESWFSHYALARYYVESGRTEAARASIIKALQYVDTARNEAMVTDLQALLFVLMDDLERAQQVLAEKALYLRATPGYFSAQGHCALVEKRYETAEAFFHKALDLQREKIKEPMLFDDETMIYIGLAWVYANQGKQKEAHVWYDTVLENDPQNYLALVGKGILLVADGAYAEGESLFLSLLEKEPNNGYVQAQLGTVYLNTGKKQQAEKFFLSAIDAQQHKNSCPYEGLGLLYLKNGEEQKAEAYFQEAITISPEREYKKYNGLARIYLKRGETEKARVLLRKSIANYPYDNESKDMLKQLESEVSHQSV